MQSKRQIGYSILLAVTLIWGTTFAVTKYSLAQAPPLYYLAWRFSIAALGLAALNCRRLFSFTRAELVGGLVSGLTMALGYITQTVGMVYSTAAKAGFITGLSVVLVPLLGALFYRRRPHASLYGFAGIAATGLALLSLDFSAPFTFNRGDLLLLICALAFALNILNLGKFAPGCRVLMLTLIQVAFTAIACWGASLYWEQPVAFGGSVWAGLFYLALLGTIVTTGGQVWGQQLVPPEKAALIFALEPVFAAAFAFILLGETLPTVALFGSALIMVGIIGAELAPTKVKSRAME